MVPVAVVILPGITLPLSDEGMVKARLNVSDSSAILSLVTTIFTVALTDPAAKVTLIGVET